MSKFKIEFRSSDGDVEVENLDGVHWGDAPLPRWLHRCRVQTRGWIRYSRFERCACGAIRMNGGRWGSRNSRRKS